MGFGVTSKGILELVGTRADDSVTLEQKAILVPGPGIALLGPSYNSDSNLLREYLYPRSSPCGFHGVSGT